MARADRTDDYEAGFWDKVDIRGIDDCWEWTAGMIKGYGIYRHRRAHRVSWEMANGKKIPPGLHVMHACDNPACVNPQHLSLGTHQENMDDRHIKGRDAKVFGPENAQSKLTEDDVVKIRYWYSLGIVLEDLANYFGISTVAASRVVRRETWANVPDPWEETAYATDNQ